MRQAPFHQGTSVTEGIADSDRTIKGLTKYQLLVV